MGEIRMTKLTWDLLDEQRRSDYEVIGEGHAPYTYVVLKLKPKAEPSGA